MLCILIDSISFTNEEKFNELHLKLKKLEIKWSNFLSSIEKNHNKFDDL